jgi:signal transduction histidine kinase
MKSFIVQKTYQHLNRIQGIRFLYDQLIHPKSTLTDLQRKEFILNIILIGTLFLCGLLFISTLISHILPDDSYSGISPLLFLGITGMFAGLLILSRKGHVQASSYLLITLYALATLYGVAQWSFVLPMIILGAIITIVISSILINTRVGFLLTIILSIAVCIITWLQIHSIIPMDIYWKHDPIVFQDVLEMCTIFFGISGIAWLSNRETERSLQRALTSEIALTEERNLLELRVEERTRTLKEIQRQEMNQLEHFAELGKVSSGIFHDLMNPLSGVIANIDQINEELPHLQETRQYLLAAASASKRMGNYLGMVHKQLRIDERLHETFHPAQEINDALALLGHKIRTHCIMIEKEMDDSLILLGNPLRFHQIALNLISNACDAYENNTNDSQSVIQIELLQKSDSLVFQVKDFGCGMNEETKNKLFTPFFTTKKKDGTGIGLSQSKTIIETEFQGKITFESAYGKGTLFTLTFPLHRNHTPHT